MLSEAGDFIGRGEPYLYTPVDGTFVVQQYEDGGIELVFTKPDLSDLWRLDFSAPYGAPLTVGTYTGATRYPFQSPDSPGLSVSGNFRGCNELTGQFEVLEVAYNGLGALVSFRARFEQYCEFYLVGMTGEIRYNAYVHVEMQAPRRLAGPAGRPLEMVVSGRTWSGGAASLRADGLPDGASFINQGDGTGRLVWIPRDDQVGSYPVRFTGADEAGGEDFTSTVLVAGTTINVPSDVPLIQTAIDTVPPGSEIIVAPGTYLENLIFDGKPLHVRSAAGREATIIDGGGVWPVAVFSRSEERDTVLEGFTLRNGYSPQSLPYFSEGAGIYILSSSPSIIDNVITGGRACSGVGIAVDTGAPLIEGNVISDNIQWGCSGGGGGGIFLLGAGRTEILYNAITDNTMYGSGGGLWLYGTTRPRVEGNEILRNFGGEGGGIYILGESGATIVNNLIADNRAYEGGGVSWIVNYGNLRPFLLNNTIADNRGTYVSGVDAYGYPAQLANNVIVGVGGQAALNCQYYEPATPGQFRNNDVYTPGGGTFGQFCDDLTGQHGNLSTDPQFQCPGLSDYRPAPGSPLVDSADDATPGIPDRDLEGQPRRLDGNADGVAKVDVGAHEFSPTAPVNACVYLTCPEDLTVTAPAGSGTAMASYAIPIGSPGSSVACTPPPGPGFLPGDTSVTCVASDSRQNTDSCTFKVTAVIPPANDEIYRAAQVKRLPFSGRLDTRYATSGYGDPGCSAGGRTVWYAFTAPRDMNVVASTVGTAYPTTLAAAVGVQGALQVLGCGAEKLTLFARARQTVYFAVGSDGDGSDLIFSLTSVVPFQFEVALNRVALRSEANSTLSISGTLRCSRAAMVALEGSISGANGRPPTGIEFTLQVDCSGKANWDVEIRLPPDVKNLGAISVSAHATATEPTSGDTVHAERKSTMVVVPEKPNNAGRLNDRPRFGAGRDGFRQRVEH